MNSEFNSSVVTITGGTGSFGTSMVMSLLKENVSEIRILSRDENKQDSMRNEIQDSRLKFFIGDVREASSIQSAIRGADFIFHAAALKQVPSCEFFPSQAVSTNIIGSLNVIEAAIKYSAQSVVCLSTDKAVYPINAMGMTKGLMEKIAQAQARSNQNSDTRIAITRYGNVMMSRGSVIPLFLKQVQEGKPITVTEPTMTRFLMSLEESIDLVKYAFLNCNSGDIFVRKAPACTIETLAMAVIRVLGNTGKVEVKKLGIRHGEKMHETLLTAEEKVHSIDEGQYFRIPMDTRTLDYQIYFEKGKDDNGNYISFNSQNTRQLSSDEVINKLMALPEFAKYKGI